jgi:hypothetical protein
LLCSSVHEYFAWIERLIALSFSWSLPGEIQDYFSNNTNCVEKKKGYFQKLVEITDNKVYNCGCYKIQNWFILLKHSQGGVGGNMQLPLSPTNRLNICLFVFDGPLLLGCIGGCVLVFHILHKFISIFKPE